MNTDSRFYVLLADIHYPEHDKAALKAALDFISKNRKNVAGVVLLGDALDCQSISRHTEGIPGLRKEGGLHEDVIGFDREILTPIQRMCPDAELVWLEGNHEAWLGQLLEKMPELKGALEFPVMLRLQERGWKWIEQGGAHFIGKLCCIHGDQVGSSIHVSKKAVDTHCCSVVMGHVHTAQMHTKTSEVRSKDKWIGYTLPCMTTINPKYGKGRPNSHIHGFGIVEKWGKKGFFNLYIPVIVDGQFSFGGKLYGK